MLLMLSTQFGDSIDSSSSTTTVSSGWGPKSDQHSAINHKNQALGWMENSQPQDWDSKNYSQISSMITWINSCSETSSSQSSPSSKETLFSQQQAQSPPLESLSSSNLSKIETYSIKSSSLSFSSIHRQAIFSPTLSLVSHFSLEAHPKKSAGLSLDLSLTDPISKKLKHLAKSFSITAAKLGSNFKTSL